MLVQARIVFHFNRRQPFTTNPIVLKFFKWASVIACGHWSADVATVAVAGEWLGSTYCKRAVTLTILWSVSSSGSRSELGSVILWDRLNTVELALIFNWYISISRVAKNGAMLNKLEKKTIYSSLVTFHCTVWAAPFLHQLSFSLKVALVATLHRRPLGIILSWRPHKFYKIRDTRF